jgi:two-component system CheB/CheR fusion protein
MEKVPIQSYSEYLSYLQKHPDEFTALFNTIEINFTQFFRNPAVWEYLTVEVIPRILANKPADAPIRVWSAGCSSGEEACTIAMVLAEALGLEQFQQRVRLFASDVDEAALLEARQGRYLAEDVYNIPPALLERYFRLEQHHYVFHPDLRSSFIIFRHNLLQDAPMSDIDLLVCRNVLIYFDIEGQARALVRFYFSLNDNGFLFLGSAETGPNDLQLFSSIDLHHRLLTKSSKDHVNPKVLIKALRQTRQLVQTEE